ncbi:MULTISPECIES: hypothetical protein [Bacillales]|uniref:hypothetical protein n=1 Tax=Bacillales TaxID=1385 RepID=UPI00035C635D|nr:MULTISPECIES: hypothetical protein [Bacillales]KMZ42524.1 hypothetical protein AC624_16110 [Bacillus sp. FJAT-27238]
MGLDLRVNETWFSTGALQLAIYAILLCVAFIIIYTIVPRFLRGIVSAATMLGGIYLFAKWIS